MRLRTILTGEGSVETIAHEHRNYTDRRRLNAESVGIILTGEYEMLRL
jgi:hypothetical protein